MFDRTARCSTGYRCQIQRNSTLRLIVWVGEIYKALKGADNIRDENNKPIKIEGTITLLAQIGSQSEMPIFYVADRLSM